MFPKKRFYFRAQTEQHTLVDGHLSRLQSAVTLGFEQINERVTIMENKIRTLSTKQDEGVEKVQNMYEKVNELHKIRGTSRDSRHHPIGLGGEASQTNKSLSSHSPHHICTDLKGTIRNIDVKLDRVYKRVRSVGSNSTFNETHALEDGNDYFIEEVDHELDGVLLDKVDVVSHLPHSSSSSKKQFFKLLRRSK